MGQAEYGLLLHILVFGIPAVAFAVAQWMIWGFTIPEPRAFSPDEQPAPAPPPDLGLPEVKRDWIEDAQIIDYDNLDLEDLERAAERARHRRALHIEQDQGQTTIHL